MEKMLKDLEEILKGDYQMKLHEMVHLIKMSYKGNL